MWMQSCWYIESPDIDSISALVTSLLYLATTHGIKTSLLNHVFKHVVGVQIINYKIQLVLSDPCCVNPSLKSFMSSSSTGSATNNTIRYNHPVRNHLIFTRENYFIAALVYLARPIRQLWTNNGNGTLLFTNVHNLNGIIAIKIISSLIYHSKIHLMLGESHLLCG